MKTNKELGFCECRVNCADPGGLICSQEFVAPNDALALNKLYTVITTTIRDHKKVPAMAKIMLGQVVKIDVVSEVVELLAQKGYYIRRAE